MKKVTLTDLVNAEREAAVRCYETCAKATLYDTTRTMELYWNQCKKEDENNPALQELGIGKGGTLEPFEGTPLYNILRIDRYDRINTKIIKDFNLE